MSKRKLINSNESSNQEIELNLENSIINQTVYSSSGERSQEENQPLIDKQEERKDDEVHQKDQGQEQDQDKKKQSKGYNGYNPVLYLMYLSNKYDNTFLLMLFLQYFNQGFRIVVSLATKDMYKRTYDLEPSYTQFLSSFIYIPWSVKIVYGLISDNIPIMGSRRKSYLIIFGLLQFVSTMVLAFFTVSSPVTATVLLTNISLCTAFSDVVIDSIMVVQSRKDPENGAEELQSFSWMVVSIGGMLGSVIGAFLTEYYTPEASYALYSIVSIIIVVCAVFMNPEVETGLKEISASQNAGQSSSFLADVKKNMGEIKEALKIPEIYNTLAFFILSGLVSPSFGSFWYYFQMEVVQFSRSTYALLTLLGYVSLFLGTTLFNAYFKEYEIRTMFKFSIIIGVFSSIISMVFVMRWNLLLGIGDLAFILLTDTVTSVLGLAFTQMPIMILFAKITPKNIEATVFAFLTGTSNFTGIFGSWTGSFINEQFVGVTSTDLSKFSTLVLIQMFTSVIPLLFIGFVPLRADCDALQKKQELIDSQKKKTEDDKEDQKINNSEMTTLSNTAENDDTTIKSQ